MHAESDAIAPYLKEIARTSAPNGVGFIHDSNAGEHRRYFQLTSVRPRRLRDGLYGARVLDQTEWRALSMTAGRIRDFCTAAGLVCISQELINWNTRRLIDCLSVLTLPTSSWARPTRVLKNPGFKAEAKAIKRRAPLYSAQVNN